MPLVDNIVVEIAGALIEANSFTARASRDQEAVRAMVPSKRGIGYRRSVPTWELTIEFAKSQTGPPLDFELLMVNGTEFDVIGTADGGLARQYSRCSIKEIEDSASDGEGNTVTVTMDALDSGPA